MEKLVHSIVDRLLAHLEPIAKKLTRLEKIVIGIFLFFVASFALVFTVAVGFGVDPIRLFIATICGCIGAGIGSGLSRIIEHGIDHNNIWLDRGLPIAGFLLGTLAEHGVSELLSRVFDPVQIYPSIVGAFVGAFAGLLSRRLMLPRQGRLADWSFVICLALGAIGGALWVIPGGIVLVVLGRQYPSAAGTGDNGTVPEKPGSISAGVTGFVLAVVSLLVFAFLGFEFQRHEQAAPGSLREVVIGGLTLALVPLSIAALILGIVALRRKQGAKVLAIVATLVSTLFLLVLAAMILSGAFR